MKKPNCGASVQEFSKALSFLFGKAMRQQLLKFPIRGENRECTIPGAGELASGSHNLVKH
jgi:hypothetical protein